MIAFQAIDPRDTMVLVFGISNLGRCTYFSLFFKKVVLYTLIIINTNMTQETVTISRKEYEDLKKLKELDYDLIRQFSSSLQDLKQGRFKRLA